MKLSEKIHDLVAEVLEGSDKFLVDFVVQPGNRFTVYIDGDHGVTIQDCQSVSRSIENNVDHEKEDFDLTVSSAGLDHPLKYERQYRKNIGQDLDVITLDGKKIEGILKSDKQKLALLHAVVASSDRRKS